MLAGHLSIFFIEMAIQMPRPLQWGKDSLVN